MKRTTNKPCTSTGDSNEIAMLPELQHQQERNPGSGRRNPGFKLRNLLGVGFVGSIVFNHFKNLAAQMSILQNELFIKNEILEQQQQHSQHSFSLANAQSYGFFDDVTDEHWRKHQKIAREHAKHMYPNKPLTNIDQPNAWYQENFDPNFSCQFEKRIGLNTNGDGPKWICDPHRIPLRAAERKAKDSNHPGCVVYSIGSNGDFNFELGMQKEVGEDVCEYHIFDMGNYAHKVPPELKRAHYHQWGLKKQGAANAIQPLIQNDKGNELYFGLLDTVRKLGHDKLDMIDVFKIDCENCEWDIYQDWFHDSIPMLQQIQVEVHKAPRDKALDFFNGLEKAGYVRTHKEPNIQYDPSCIEFAFLKIHQDFFSASEGMNETGVSG